MNHSTSVEFTKAAAALVKAQKAFGPALKTSTNPHFRSKYADLSACIEAVLEPLNQNGLALMQQVHPTDEGVSVETLFIHETGEIISCGVLSMPVSKKDPQAYGSALTYARRYSLMAACGIAPEDDDGNAASKTQSFITEKTVDPNVIADHIAAIDASSNGEELAAAYKAGYAACNGNQEFQTKVIKAKKMRIDRAKKEKTSETESE